MLAHLKEFAPELCRLRGDELILQVIRGAVWRARYAGFSLRGPMQLYLEFMFVFGYGFDTDPQLPWVQDTLLDRSLTDEQSRSTRLYIRSREYLKEVAGPSDVYASAALAKLNILDEFRGSTGRPLEARILEGMEKIYPQKFQAVGDAKLRLLIAKAAQQAALHRLPAEKGTALLAGLMFGFGHEVISDPLYPWVLSTLTDPLTTDREGAVARLYDKTKTYVAAMTQAKAAKNV